MNCECVNALVRFRRQLELAKPRQIMKALKEKGWIPPAETHSSDQIASLVKCRATTGIQPKSSKLPPLVREHKAIIVVRGPHEASQQMCH